MRMVDTAKIFIKAGDGGDGMVHLKRGKSNPKGGPDGGDGGKGGDVYLETDPHLATLGQFAYKQKFLAEDGKGGGVKKMTGRNGVDLVVKVPVGTMVIFKGEKERVLDLEKPGIKLLIAKGGKGGKGNWQFRSSTNQTPREAEPGGEGESYWLELELKLLADVGLIGLPNAGKSTLLSVVSSAKPKIADYEFTTLSPNLGVMKVDMGDYQQTLIIADVPGLIEGAHQGKGLGDMFLRHAERTRVLVHLLAPRRYEVEWSQLGGKELAKRMWEDYQIIRQELTSYGQRLEEKQEIAVLNKVDLLEEEQLEEIVAFFIKKKVELEVISAATTQGIDKLKQRIAYGFMGEAT